MIYNLIPILAELATAAGQIRAMRSLMPELPSLRVALLLHDTARNACRARVKDVVAVHVVLHLLIAALCGATAVLMRCVPFLTSIPIFRRLALSLLADAWEEIEFAGAEIAPFVPAELSRPLRLSLNPLN